MGAALMPVMGLISTGFQAGSGLAGALNEADATRAKAKYQKTVSDSNARFAELNATQAIQEGDRAALQVRQQGDAITGTQRAGFAGQGVDVNTGTAADVQRETQTLSAMDALTLKNNAWRKAYGYKVEAINATRKGQFAQKAADQAASDTLLTGGLNAFSTLAKGGYDYYRNTRKA